MVPGPAILMVLMLEFWLGVHVFNIFFDFTVYCAHDPPVSFIFKMEVRKVSTSSKGRLGMTWRILWSDNHCYPV